ncbi:MAG: hypothetical protein AB2L14_02500 [Candidatus Xenobiia bacterium LiM19]
MDYQIRDMDFHHLLYFFAFPFTREATFPVTDLVILPFIIFRGVVVLAYLMDPLLQFLVMKDIEGFRSLGKFRGPREKERVETLREASRYAIRGLVIIVALIVYLKILKVNTTTIAASAGAPGVILSIIGQVSLIRLYALNVLGSFHAKRERYPLPVLPACHLTKLS